MYRIVPNRDLQGANHELRIATVDLRREWAKCPVVTFRPPFSLQDSIHSLITNNIPPTVYLRFAE